MKFGVGRVECLELKEPNCREINEKNIDYLLTFFDLKRRTTVR